MCLRLAVSFGIAIGARVRVRVSDRLGYIRVRD